MFCCGKKAIVTGAGSGLVEPSPKAWLSAARTLRSSKRIPLAEDRLATNWSHWA